MRQFQFRLKFVIDNFRNMAYNLIRRRHRKLENAGDQFKGQPQMFITTTVQPHQVPSPYKLGFDDAQAGKDFVPETYYVNRRQMQQYAEGFIAARPNPYAAAFLGHRNFVPAEVA